LGRIREKKNWPLNSPEVLMGSFKVIWAIPKVEWTWQFGKREK
jgi:hypothetical protein